MLKQHAVEFTYREYRSQPLTESELQALFDRLRVGPKALLRRRDRAFRALGLTGDEDDDTLTALMHEHPTLLERPIGILGNRAIVGRPPERLLELIADQHKRA